MITIPHPVNANHNGGQLQFLGNLLYFGTGDGGSGGDPPNNAQNKDVLLGKLLRIDPRSSGGKPYSVPADNPFVGKPGRDEIYSYGLRNPFRFSFDTAHGQPRIAIGDVGQNQFEELDYTTVARAERRQLRLGRLRGLLPLHGRKQRHARSGRHRQADLRLPATAAAAAARSSAATSSAIRACQDSAVATSTPTSARGSCAPSSRT